MQSLDSKVEEQTHQLNSLNMSIFDIERNTSAQLELEHKDVVSLAVSETFYWSRSSKLVVNTGVFAAFSRWTQVHLGPK